MPMNSQRTKFLRKSEPPLNAGNSTSALSAVSGGAGGISDEVSAGISGRSDMCSRRCSMLEDTQNLLKIASVSGNALKNGHAVALENPLQRDDGTLDLPVVRLARRQSLQRQARRHQPAHHRVAIICCAQPHQFIGNRSD